MGTKKGLIFGSCTCNNWDFLRPYLGWPHAVIGADGGIRLAYEAGFTPTVYIGDNDSGGFPEPGLIAVTLPKEKDFTDLEAAYEWAIANDFRDLIFTGCSGGRLDHHMAAMGLLERAAREGIHAVILSPGNSVEVLLPGEHVFPNMGYTYFSLIPLDKRLEGLSISGAKYPVSHCEAVRGSSLTVSNEFCDDTITVSFSAGCCFYIQSL